MLREVFPIIYFMNKKIEKFQNNVSVENKPVDIALLSLGIIITWYALYLSFKCNQGFHLGSVLVALFFSPIYIIYRLAVPCNIK